LDSDKLAELIKNGESLTVDFNEGAILSRSDQHKQTRDKQWK